MQQEQEMAPINEPVPRIDEMFRQREEDEIAQWRTRAFVKILELFGFIGTFLCTNVIGFTFSVLLTAFALGWDFWLQYKEWRSCRRFQQQFA